MSEVNIEKGVVSSEGLVNEHGYFIEQPADFEFGIPESLSFSAWLVVATELCERFNFYGSSLMFTTYMREQLKVKKARSVSINRGFTFFAYFTTVLGAFISDQWLGKYKTITIFASWYVLGTVLLAISALKSFSHSTGLALFIVSTYLFIAFGTGGIKSNVSAFVAEQVKVGYRPTSTPGVYIDSRATTERAYRYFYWAINVGALVGMALTPSLSTKYSYFVAYLVPACVMVVGILVFVPGYKLYVKKKPSGSVFGKVYRCMKYARQNKNPENAHWLDSAKGLKDAEWDDAFVDGLKRSVRACKVFLFYPFYWALYNNMTDNFINQGMQMTRPSWLQASQLNVVNSLFLVVTIPIFDYFIFPFLAKRGIFLGPIKRITIGLWIVAVTFAYVTIIQRKLYNTPPFFNFTGDNVTDDSFNNISIWLQIPAYIGISISEIFASITGLEYAFSQAPTELKSALSALFLFTNCGGSLIGLILSIWSGDPTVYYTFIAQTALIAVIAVIFWFCFKHYDEEVRQQTTYN
ncbi:hypothetical protein BB559_002276 [Furculomyces boomerangus]|uniref:Major facilitator superfamily (MFS) profile domain-containing protein n=1 Tax=Furculomyces boomerangus TaxID=61424 RepID=A0A2T9YWL0_9FUNG|nr:hypothetical protein BB559_002276 [Furculomyces boomerangus]